MCVNSRFRDAEVLAQAALPKSAFDEFVENMDKGPATSQPLEGDTHMGTTGAKRPEAEADPVDGGPAETTKRRNLSRQRTERPATSTEAFAALSPSASSSSTSASSSSTSAVVAGPAWLRILPSKRTRGHKKLLTCYSLSGTVI